MQEQPNLARLVALEVILRRLIVRSCRSSSDPDQEIAEWLAELSDLVEQFRLAAPLSNDQSGKSVASIVEAIERFSTSLETEFDEDF